MDASPAMDGLPLGRIIKGDALEGLRTLPAKSVQCAVTSPPFWGMRDYRVDGESLAGQYGQEATPEAHVTVMVAVFRELRRVLRDDGTLWLNYGDSYASGGGNGAQGKNGQRADRRFTAPATGVLRRPPGLKPKDLVMMPARVAMALQADGWWLRSDIVWAKPNPMPESVTDRPTRSHEYLFLLTKRARYFYDAEAVREGVEWDANGNKERKYRKDFGGNPNHPGGQAFAFPWAGNSRNLRSVWNIATQPYPGAHYATFPEALVEPCIKAGTSEKGACPACGAPWARVVEKGAAPHDGNTGSNYPKGSNAHNLALLRQGSRGNGREYDYRARTLDWRPACGCEADDPVPCIVLDPFAGSGTVGIVAYKLGREFVGIDLAGGDADLGGHTAHDRIEAARNGGRSLDEHLGHKAVGQMELLGGGDAD